MSDAGWGIIFILGLVIVVGFVLAILIWQIFKTNQTKTVAQIQASGADSYRKLAEQTAESQAQTAERLEKLTEDVGDLRQRVASIEKMLSEVE